MPYIEPEDREDLAQACDSNLDHELGGDSLNAVIDTVTKRGSVGELNYVISTLCDRFVSTDGSIHYEDVNKVIGVLECTKLELYRRVAAPYEDLKKRSNGEVFHMCVDLLERAWSKFLGPKHNPLLRGGTGVQHFD